MSILNEAFKKLQLLDEDVISLDDDGLKKLAEIEDTEKEDVVSITDLDAENEDELKDNYDGKVIIDCNVCHSKIFKDKDDIHLSEDETVCNEDEGCPYCYSHDGYSIIGEVAPFKKEEEKVEVEDEIEDDDDKIEDKEEVKVEDEEKVDESLKEDLSYGELLDIQEKWEEYKKRTGKNDASAALEFIDTECKNYVDEDDEYRDHILAMISGIEEMDESKKISESAKNRKSRRASRVNESIKRGLRRRAMEEGFSKVDIETEEDKLSMTADENGKITVTNEPIVKEEVKIEDSEVVAPVSDEVKDEIVAKSEDDTYVDLDVDEFEEEDFDKLGEGYLKKVYENVNSYKTSGIKMNEGKLVVEGVINFNSGKNKKTSFIFESHNTNGKKVRFIGENAQITKGKKAFCLDGKLKNKKFIGESLSYRYSVKGSDGKMQRLRGVVKK